MAYLAPTQTGTVDQAKSYLNQQAQQRRGSALSDQEFSDVAGKIGYTGGDVTGAQVNSALDVLGWGDAGGTGVPLPASSPAPQPGTKDTSAAIAQLGSGQPQQQGQAGLDLNYGLLADSMGGKL